MNADKTQSIMPTIDRRMCRLPEEHSLYKVTGTYGRKFSAFVSAKTPKDAKKIWL